MTAPTLARWDDTRARIAAIRAKLPTASTEQVHAAVTLLLDVIEENIADGTTCGPGEPAFYRLKGQASCVAYLSGALVGAEVTR